MNIAIGSCFRNVPPFFVAAYASRIEAFIAALKGSNRVTLIASWGDCLNGTYTYLHRNLAPLPVQELRIVERSHGLGDFGSCELPDRLRGFGFAANGVFENVPEDTDVVVYVESDIRWTPEVILRAAEQLQPGIDLIALPPFIDGTEQFYDIWGFRGLNGIRFSPFEQCPVDRLTPVSSAGTCLVMRGEVARTCRCTDQALVGFCEQATDRGYKLWTDWSQRVIHPR